jgi:hypothetical protein
VDTAELEEWERQQWLELIEPGTGKVTGTLHVKVRRGTATAPARASWWWGDGARYVHSDPSALV